MSRKLSDETKAPGVYKTELRALQFELAKFQNQIMESKRKLLVIFEGRDGAGKDGAIKRITQHMSPRETRVVALDKPSDRDQRLWYFQRYVAHLPAAGEVVLFNRSWYNRAGVERVMKFCSNDEYEEFMRTVPRFEELLTHCGITILKYYLDISKNEQKKRLKERRDDLRHRWKVSPIDASAVKRWRAYSDARNEMFARTHSVFAPWIVVRADNKKATRLNVIRDLLSRTSFDGKDRQADLSNPEEVFLYNKASLENGAIAP